MDNERQRRFTWIYATGAFVLVLVTIFAVASAVQEHNDRVLSEELSETASELQDTGARIASIREAEMKNMDDYIRAFSEIGPLLDTYDQHVQRITDLYNEARERDKRLLSRKTLQKTTSHELGKHVGDSGYNAGVEQSHEAGDVDHTKHGSTAGIGTNAVLA
jgi:hypothetical protein